MIPLVSGNLSVDRLLSRLTGGAAPLPGATRREIERFAELGFSGVEDYLAWALIEPREGSFDWSPHRENAALCRAHGLRYFVYPWLHVVPEWFVGHADFTASRCLEHGGECSWPSPFAPGTLTAWRRFYGELARALGRDIDALCVGFLADYGEVGYPTGWAAWVSRLVPPRDHVHVGWWFGDPHARAAFAQFAREHGVATERERASEPERASPRLLAEFAITSMTAFVDRALAVVRELFPATPLWIKLGHGGESAHYGIDATALARVAARHGAGVRTTQATLPVLHQKRIATPCRHFGVPLSSEPPIDVGRETVLMRLFDDATSGAVEVFEYPEHRIGARDLSERHGSLLDGALPECDVGLFFDVDALRAQPHVGMPPVLFDLADALRDRFDFEVIDSQLIDAGALASLSVVALVDGGEVPLATQHALVQFVRGGGTLVVAPAAAAAAAATAALSGSSATTAPLSDLLARVPAADDLVELVGAPSPSSLVRLGMPGESQWLAGDWHGPEEASQFAGGLPRGEFARWSGAHASVVLPVARRRRALLEVECWVHPLAVSRRRVVRANGAVLGELARAGLQRFAAWIPGDLLSADVVEITFECETFQPCHLVPGDPLGGDHRELGVSVLSLRVTLDEAAAMGSAAARPPELRGCVDAARLDAATELCHGAGRVIVSRRAPLAGFVGLLDYMVRAHSDWGRHAPTGGDGAPPTIGLRATRFRDRWLLWNRGAVVTRVHVPGTGDDGAPTVPAGAVVAVALVRAILPAPSLPQSTDAGERAP